MKINEEILRRLIIEAFLNAFTVLGVGTDATDAEIKGAYRSLALKNHPDRNKGDESATERFVNAQKAFERLSNRQDTVKTDRWGGKVVIPWSPFIDAYSKPGEAAKQSPTQGQHQMKTCPDCGRTVAVKDSRFVNHYRQPPGASETNTKCPESGRMPYERKQQNPPPGAPPPPPNAGQQRKQPHGRPNKSDYKVYNWKQGRRVVRVGGKLFGTRAHGNLGNGQYTRFYGGERARVNPDGNRMRVNKVDGDHSQTWDPIDEARRIIDELVIEEIVRIASTD